MVILEIIAHNLVKKSHRMLGCPKGKKLDNQLNLTFGIRNLEEIIKSTVSECFNCALD